MRLGARLSKIGRGLFRGRVRRRDALGRAGLALRRLGLAPVAERLAVEALIATEAVRSGE